MVTFMDDPLTCVAQLAMYNVAINVIPINIYFDTLFIQGVLIRSEYE